MSMSSFTELFGGSEAKIDDKVAGIFLGGAGPVARPKVAKRTVVEVAQAEGSGDSESNSEASGSEGDESFHTPRKSMDNEDLEGKYFEKLLTKEKTADNEDEETDESESEKEEEPKKDEEASEDDKESKDAKTKTSKAKVVDLKESELEKAERTVFVGNVPVQAVNDKKTYKKFKKLFKKYGKIQSIRFRSISFGEALPRKVAFVQRKFHESRETLNAYIVYESKDASLRVPQEANGAEFEHCHLRVDHITHPAPRDHKRTVFVGNLNFEEREETLWRYFNEKTGGDVESVRIVRDSKTNLGKGFAYVQFKDSLSVNKALLLNDRPISTESKRKLRISRSKAHAKPSILSPNHIDNQRKPGRANRKQRLMEKLNDNQKTKLGRAKAVLGKADRSTAGSKVVVEGQRASKGDTVAGIKGRTKKPRHKKPRIRERSTKFKQERQSLNPK